MDRMESGRPLDTTHALVWASWRGACPQKGWDLFNAWGEQGMAFDPETFGQLLVDASFSRDAPREARLAHLMQQSCGYDELHGVLAWCEGCTPRAEGPDIDMKFDMRVAPDGKLRGTHAKFAQLVTHVISSDVGGPWPLLAAVQVFAENGGLGGLRSYLKIAGSRADKFDEAVKSKRFRAGEVAVEYGTFLGTTAIRLADRASKMYADLGYTRSLLVVSFEVDPLHLCISRWMIELAGLSWATEVWPGIGADAAKRAIDELGQAMFGVVFFDHRGTKYHEDLAQLEKMQALSPGSLVLADNVLRPGAPQFLWRVHCHDSYEATTWAFMDNTPFPAEDWLSVAKYVGPGWQHPWPPAALERLSWDSDRWRRRSQEGGLRVSDWSAFAHHAAEELARFGIEAQPWFDPNAPPPVAPEGEDDAEDQEWAKGGDGDEQGAAAKDSSHWPSWGAGEEDQDNNESDKWSEDQTSAVEH
mmetsp:Transcript_3666/g.6508  ORF Transcript_3666/g.6508 Transcript_3666/m.6508 type:complete len:472 (+) Transcript_3666:88-1503(+)